MICFQIGDARSTSMSKPPKNELNIGQLCREHYGDENVALIGFGTHTGTVSAASNWDGDMEVKQIVPSQRGSIEVCVKIELQGRKNFFLKLN